MNFDPLDMLRERAMLVTVKQGGWGAKITDKELRRRLQQDSQATDKTKRIFNATKELLPTADALEELRKIAGKLRNYNYEVTRTWDDNNKRILPTPLFNEHQNTTNQYKLEFEQALKEFERNYDRYKEEAKPFLGTAWRDSDYPEWNLVKQKFYIHISYYPIPHTDDFRVSLSSGQLSQIRRQLSEESEAKLKHTHEQLYTRLHKVVNHMAEKLEDPQGKFKDTLSGNIKRLVTILDDLNIEKDINLTNLTQEAAPLGQVDPQKLRDDVNYRQNIATNARKSADRIQEHMNALNL